MNLNDLPGAPILGRVEDVRPYVWRAAVNAVSLRTEKARG